MTLAEFMKELEKTPRTWGFSDVTPLNPIRQYDSEGNSYCPITAVCFLVKQIKHPPSRFREAAIALDLNISMADTIIGAADSDVSSDRFDICREFLLKACGLNGLPPIDWSKK